MDPKETEGLSTRLCSREQVVLTVSSVLHLLNVGLGSAEALDLVESSRDCEVLRLSIFPNTEALDPLESLRDNDVLLIISFPNLFSDVLYPLNVGLATT